MFRNTMIASLLASSALTLAVATPVLAASEKDRAREAIAAAEAKIHTAESLGTSADAPREAGGARAALATAREDLKSGHKDVAIREAIRAQALADTAIGASAQHKDDAIASAREDQKATADAARDQVAAAKDQAAAAQDQAVGAQQQAATAQQQAAEANARAEAARQSAAASAADAAAARNAAAMTPPAPQVETTVTTQRTGAAHHTTRTKTKVTRRATTPSAPSEQITTTTKVTPQQ